jgi:ADP-ribose pyrophosphatase YjhB (NUDIX family)/predicted GNAT family N-acyltransferase
LVVKRNEEPFQGQWDFVGGYMEKNETPEEALKREIKEELNSDCEINFIQSFPGTSQYQNETFPVLNFAYFVKLKGKINLNSENSHFQWLTLVEIKDITFDTNQKILKFLKEHFLIDKKEVMNLIHQLDSNAIVNIENYYQAALEGHVSKIYDQGSLIGMGWIFPRQTLLRKQAVVEDMIVNQAYRGQGLGEKILRDLLEWAKQEKIEVIELTTNSKRLAANGLYQKVGFKLHPTNHYLLKL